MSTDAPLAPPPADTPVDLTTKIEAPASPEPAKTEPAAEVVEDPGDLTTKEPEGDEQPDGEKKNVPGSQKLKRRLQLIEQEHSRALEELDTLRREREQRQTPQTPQNPQGKPGIDREPSEQDFPNDWLAFERAKTAWDVRQSVREEMRGLINEDKTKRDQTIRVERERERLLAYEENAEAARERIPDFDKVISTAANTINVKREVLDELLASDKSALLQYHLAKNPDKVRELNGMNVRELAKEIGRLEARVHLPTPKKATEADPPPSNVRGASTPHVDAQTGPDDMNAYVAWRRKQSAS
jgi:hypothetical protein